MMIILIKRLNINCGRMMQIMNGFLRSVLLLDQECFLHQNITVPAASPNQQRFSAEQSVLIKNTFCADDSDLSGFVRVGF